MRGRGGEGATKKAHETNPISTIISEDDHRPAAAIRKAIMSSFTAVPVLDYSLSKDGLTRPAFLDELRRVLLEVGFLYIKNTGIDETLIEEVTELGKAFFDLPESEKLRLEMKNCERDRCFPLTLSFLRWFRKKWGTMRGKRICGTEWELLTLDIWNYSSALFRLQPVRK